MVKIDTFLSVLVVVAVCVNLLYVFVDKFFNKKNSERYDEDLHTLALGSQLSALIISITYAILYFMFDFKW